MGPPKRIAILGAGPVGLEAALYARALGHEALLLERGAAVAENVRRWEFVRLFSPWRLNVSKLGLDALRRLGLPEPPEDEFPTGRELLRDYLMPLGDSLGSALRTSTEVLGVSRVGWLKAESPGSRERGWAPFRILFRMPSGEEEASADIVIDATGVYATPAALGDGGIPALGEESLRTSIDYHLPDVLGKDRARFAGRTTLLVGAGFSAATTLTGLLRLASESPGTRVVWARRRPGLDPLPTYPNDPLPERSRLAAEVNRIAAKPPDGVTLIAGCTVRRLTREGDRICVVLRPTDGGSTSDSIAVDRVVAQVGYRPDAAIHRELQVHQCYATEGPMALAAALLGKGGGDCLAQKALGPETLRNPEPGFFILGQKSYGRRNDFLLRVGRDQVRDVFRLIEEAPDLDLNKFPRNRPLVEPSSSRETPRADN